MYIMEQNGKYYMYLNNNAKSLHYNPVCCVMLGSFQLLWNFLQIAIQNKTDLKSVHCLPIFLRLGSIGVKGTEINSTILNRFYCVSLPGDWSFVNWTSPPGCINTAGLEGGLYGGLAELTRSSSLFSTSNVAATVSPALPVIAV